MTWYRSFTLALTNSHGDPAARKSLVERDPERAAQWARRARSELRLSLWRGQVVASKQIFSLIRAVDDLMQASGRLSPADEDQIDSGSMSWLLNAVHSVSTGDHWSSRDQLARLGDSPTSGPTLRWLAHVWHARAEVGLEDVEAAEDVLVDARRLAGALDQAAQAATSCVLAEVEAHAEEVQLALERVDAAIATLGNLEDSGWLAGAWLTRAQVLRHSGFDVESVSAAEHARGADEDWIGPLLFLARRDLERGLLDDAERRLSVASPRTDDVTRELSLVQRAREGRIPVWVLAEYVALRDVAPSEAMVGQLRALLTYQPGFAEARVTLGWAQLHLGRVDEAEETFRSLLADKDLESRLSVLNGLECAVALKQQKQRKSFEAEANEHSAATVQGLPAVAVEKDAPAASPLPEKDYLSAATARGLPAVSAVPPTRHDSMSGDLSILSLPEILEFLRSTKRTGVLALSSSDGSGSLCLAGGMLVKASSPRLSGSLIEKIPESCATSSSQCSAEQIRDAVREFLAWNTGRFAFQSAGPCNSGGFVVELDPQQVLMDAMEL